MNHHRLVLTLQSSSIMNPTLICNLNIDLCSDPDLEPEYIYTLDPTLSPDNQYFYHQCLKRNNWF